MKVNKKLIIVTLILLSLFMIGAVSAASNTETNVNSDVSNEKVSHNVADKNTDTISEKKSVSTNKKYDDKLSNKPDNDLLKDDEKTFSELQQNITDAGNNPTEITLQHDYIQDGDTAIEIKNNQKITINGNGHTLDAKGKSDIFLYINSELILENLKLINSKSNGYSAISSTGNLTIINCTFINNTGHEGGAICAYKSNMTITQSTFINNTGHEGGAIGIIDSNANITQSTFINNKATSDYGGAIFIVSSNVNITQSTFINNTAPTGDAGGAIKIRGDGEYNLTNNLFKKNHDTNGYAIYLSADGVVGENNILIDNDIYYQYSGVDIGAKTVPEGSFSELYAMLTTGTTGPKTLTSDYTYNKTSGSSDYEFIGGIPINTTVHIIGNGHTISGDETARIFKVTGMGNLILENLTLTKGQGQLGNIDDGNWINCGGAIYTYNAKVTLINTTLQNNNATCGGAISAWSNSQINITTSTLKNNQATGEYGYGGAITAGNSTITITTSTLKNNNATYGGAIYTIYNSQVTINNATLQNNNATYGGGAISAYENSQVNITTSTLKNNQATNGGAIYVFDNSQVTINNATLQNNNATYGGGAIYALDNSQINITTSTLQNNNALSNGGAIWTRNSNITINNSTLKNNNATHNGGAIYTQSKSELSVISSLIMNNNADINGSAIYGWNFDDLIVNHNIFLNNSETNSVIYLRKTSSTNIDYNLDSNWFGNTADNPTNKPNIVFEGIDDSKFDNWLFLNATANPNPVQVLNTTNITFELFLYNSSSENVTSYDNSQLIPVNFTITSTNGDVEPTTAGLNDTIIYKANNYGKCSVTATIENVEYTIEFTIKYPTRFTIENINDITEGDTINLIINEANNYTGPVTVTIGSENYTVTLTDGFGKTSINNLKPGTYTATINFPGNDEYENATANSNTFKVNSKPSPTPSKISTKIVAKQKTFKLSNKNKKYTITLKDKNNKAIKNAQVTLKVKGKTYKAQTNSKGKATFKLTKLNKKGTYKAVIKYNGNKKYKKSSKKVKITIQFQNIGKNSKNKALVKKIQKSLKQKGYYKHAGKYYLMIDGKYQTWTTKEVKRYQKNHGLKVTGTVDDQTALKLGII